MLLSSRSSFAFVLAPCLLAGALLGVATAANAASVGQTFVKLKGSANNNVIQIRRRGRAVRLQPPIVPYIAYDYPYYYSRGFYPTHIGPGYIYYGSRYPYSRLYSMRSGPRCSHLRRRCVSDWRYRQGRRKRVAAN